MAIYDPRYTQPLLLATALPAAVSPQHLAALYRDRWPVEHLPLVAKQLIGAARQFVHAPDTCQRLPELALPELALPELALPELALPELALLAGAILSYAAATTPAMPTGYWDRHPRPTAGRFRRALTGRPFPTDFPLAAHIRAKRARTDHLRTGFWGQRALAPRADDPLAA